MRRHRPYNPIGHRFFNFIDTVMAWSILIAGLYGIFYWITHR